MAAGRPGCLARLVQADLLAEPGGRAGAVAGRSLSSTLDLGKRGRARAGKERERWVCFGLGFGGGRRLELVLFRLGQTLAVQFRSGARVSFVGYILKSHL